MTDSGSYPPFSLESIRYKPIVAELGETGCGILPIIDLQTINPQELGNSCRDWGIFFLKNHGIPENLISRVHTVCKEIMNLKFEIKQERFKEGNIRYFWGSPAMKNLKNLNWLEGLHIPLLGFNLEQESTDFEATMEEYGRHMVRICRIVFDEMMMTLGMNSAESSGYLSDLEGFLRVYRYPACSKSEPVIGMDAHTDSTVLTMLIQNEVNGLQVFRDDKWIDIALPNSLLLVNLGDMMQVISNDQYKSSKHRVVARNCCDRISIGYFSFPPENTQISSSLYRSFSYRQFQEQVRRDIDTTGFKVGLDRFKINK